MLRVRKYIIYNSSPRLGRVVASYTVVTRAGGHEMPQNFQAATPGPIGRNILARKVAPTSLFVWLRVSPTASPTLKK